MKCQVVHKIWNMSSQYITQQVQFSCSHYAVNCTDSRLSCLWGVLLLLLKESFCTFWFMSSVLYPILNYVILKFCWTLWNWCMGNRFQNKRLGYYEQLITQCSKLIRLYFVFILSLHALLQQRPLLKKVCITYFRLSCITK